MNIMSRENRSGCSSQESGDKSLDNDDVEKNLLRQLKRGAEKENKKIAQTKQERENAEAELRMAKRDLINLARDEEALKLKLRDLEEKKEALKLEDKNIANKVESLVDNGAMQECVMNKAEDEKMMIDSVVESARCQWKNVKEKTKEIRNNEFAKAAYENALNTERQLDEDLRDKTLAQEEQKNELHERLQILKQKNEEMRIYNTQLEASIKQEENKRDEFMKRKEEKLLKIKEIQKEQEKAAANLKRKKEKCQKELDDAHTEKQKLLEELSEDEQAIEFMVELEEQYEAVLRTLSTEE